MGHRQFFPLSKASDVRFEDVWNRPYPDPRFCLGTAAVGVNPLPYYDMAPRSNNIPLSNPCFEIPNHNRRSYPGTSHNSSLHPSSSSSSYQMPPNHIQAGPCYGGFAHNSHMDYERAPFKRKNPAISMSFERGNNTHHNAGSSVNFQANLMLGPQHQAWDPNSMPCSYRGNNRLTAGEGSQRNVRSRQSFGLHLENNETGVYRTNNHHCYLQAVPNISGLTAAEQWGHTPHGGCDRRILYSENNRFNRDMNYSMEIHGGNHHNFLHDRILHTPLLTPQAPPSQVVNADQSSFDQRMHLYSSAASYHQPVGFSAPSIERYRPDVEGLPSYRHSGPSSIVGHSSERNERSRGVYDRSQPFSYGANAYSGWASEDPSTYYDVRNLFDQHHDMRLDIDNMSYEELLALGDRIGNVSTGLSEDTISSCLVEATYCLYQILENEERNCVICLDEYKYKENIGRLACGHDFHSSCIKKWLSIKNACPICKGSAVPDALKEK